MMELAYYFTRRQFGKVLTPLRAHSARLPLAFGLFYTNIGKPYKKLLPPETALLIRERVGTDQRRSFLHGYWPVFYHQGVDE